MSQYKIKSTLDNSRCFTKNKRRKINCIRLWKEACAIHTMKLLEWKRII